MNKDLETGPYLQKLTKIIPYWIKHNNEHIDEHVNWLEGAKKLGLTEIADELGEVIKNLKKANRHIDNIDKKIDK